MSRYLGELPRQLANRFIALYYFHSEFVHGVVILLFNSKFSPINGFYKSLKTWYPHTADVNMRTWTLPCCLLPRLPSLDDCVVTKQTFCVVLQRFMHFCSNSIIFISTVLWALAMKTTVVSRKKQGNWLKRSFKKAFSELINLLRSLQIHNIRFRLRTKDRLECHWLFRVLIFFPTSCLKIGMQLIHECGLYTSLYGKILYLKHHQSIGITCLYCMQ